MRYALLLFIFMPLAGLGQFNGQWKPLPEAIRTKAVINKRPAVIDTILSREKPKRIQEIPSQSKLEFISIVVPDTLEKPIYKAYPIHWSRKESVSNGLVFKDVASYNIKYLDKAHGLPSNYITSIAEDTDGLIYLTSTDGLMVFNGTDILIYENHPFFSFASAKTLYKDREGRMWIANEEQVGYIYEDKLYLPEPQIFGGVHQQPFREDENGDFFISTNFNGVFIVKQDFILHYEKGLPHSMTADAIRTSDGKLWIAFPRHGVGYIKNDSLFAYKELNECTARSFLERDGELWIGNYAGPLQKHRNDSLFTVKLEVKSNYVYAMEQNSKGVWIASFGKGVFLIKPNGEYHWFNQDNGLINRNSFDLYIDSYENVWVADYLTGISRIDENLFYFKSNIFLTTKISGSKKDQDGNNWYFRNGGLVVKETPDEYVAYRNIPDSEFLLHAHCMDGFTRNDGIWMGSFGMGIIQLKEMEYTYYQWPDDSYENNTMFYLQPDSAGGIWTITPYKLLYLDNGHFYDYSYSQEWKDYKFTGSIMSPDGELFLFTEKNGLILLQNDRYQNIELLPNSSRVYYVYKDHSGIIWFFMNNQIQLLKQDGSISRIENSIINDNPIFHFLEIEKDNFLGVSSNGIISVKNKGGEYEMKIFDRNQGLYMIDNSSIQRNSIGEIFIAHRDGVIKLDSTFINKKSAPKLSFNRLEVDGDTLSGVDNGFSVEQGKQIRAVFNKIYWGNKSSLHYKLGHNNSTANWNEQASNSITFQELAHGNYTLTVFAKGDELISEEVSVQFRILPYWYQTTWAKVLFAVLILGSIIAYFLNRERKARVIKVQLEGLVAEKTSQLASQLEQKEILMQEVHHRVKNNLTFLKSLLYLRSKASENEDVKIILDECQARIQSMALVHQNLYDVDDASQVDFAYFLRELFTELEIMFDQTDLKLNLDTNDQKLDMKLSVFLGLILNELITNTIKYAYNGNEDKMVFIVFESTEDNFTLSYSDNGQGLPPDFDIASTSGFGFKLIRILLDQIDAEISYNRNIHGTFTILIPR